VFAEGSGSQEGEKVRIIVHAEEAWNGAVGVEESYERSGKHVRVSAQLIDARTDMHLWAERYDRDVADVFAIQSEIAKRIADQLQAKISPSEKAAIENAPTTDLAAFDLYTRAKTLLLNSLFSARAMDIHLQAVELLNQAVARDPHFLLAWCLLSRVHGNIYFFEFDHTPARLDLTNTAVQPALRLQKESSEDKVTGLRSGADDYGARLGAGPA
jgi:hypothetical protein